MKPFLRWAGGKHSQLDQILPHLTGKRLLEPFVGAGSVFMNAGFDEVIINDVNTYLTDLYSAIIHNGDYVLEKVTELSQWCNSEARYKILRDKFNSDQYNSLSKAIFFLVLNKACYNGLCRFNKSGKFNTPWGKKVNLHVPEESIRYVQDMGLNIQVCNTDFSFIFDLAREDDVIFCDPPYEPHKVEKGQGKAFTSYSGRTFLFGDQKRLVFKAKEAQARGAKVVITNSSADHLVDFYEKSGFEIHELIAKRNISASAEKRGTVTDIIAILKP